MAARRVTKISIDWHALAERIPAEYMPQFNSLRGRVDSNIRKMMALPEKPPAIDWAYYKSAISKAALVDTFQKKYDTLQIPFPSDTVTAKINEHQKLIEEQMKKEIAESNENINKMKAQLAYLQAQIPMAEMTLQELGEAYPEMVVDAINDPTPWPHDPEEIAAVREEEKLRKEGKLPPPPPSEH